MAVLATVTVSACAQIAPTVGPALGGGPGLSITGFSVEPPEVFSGSTSRFIMDLENSGGAIVTDAASMAVLIGPTGWSLTNQVQHFGKDLRPADPVRQTPADTKRLTWSLTAPTISRGQIRTDTFDGVIYYDYETTGRGTIWVYSEAEADAARASGRTLRTSEFTTNAGPLAVAVTISPDPVVLFGTEDTFTMTLRLSNAGGGTIYQRGAVTYTETSPGAIVITRDELNKVNVAITAPGLTIAECTGDQELIAGRDTTLICDVTVDTPPTTFVGYTIDVSAIYGYSSLRTVQVKVSGR